MHYIPFTLRYKMQASVCVYCVREIRFLFIKKTKTNPIKHHTDLFSLVIGSNPDC